SLICGYEMEPAHPPLPMPMNLPFHPEIGIQSSMWISETGDGFSVAATRQHCRRFRMPPGGGGPPARSPAAGGTTPPLTVCAMVIVVPGSLVAVRLSHVCGDAMA